MDVESELPEDVRRLSDAVSEKLGRPSHCRKVKNRDHWFVQDPVFSFVQHGMKKGNTGYRVGYQYQKKDRSLWFILVHSPIIAGLFKRNLALSTLLKVLEMTAQFRDCHYMLWSSKLAARDKSKKDTMHAYEKTFKDFADSIKPSDDGFDFVEDLFPIVPNTGKAEGKAKYAGNTFCLLLSNKDASFDSTESIRHLVEMSWPLFLCLYPVRPIEKRTAALARKMIAKKIAKTCEFSLIDLPPNSGISPLCRGQIQGAHIKPDALGGADLPENGMWLCEYHHRLTEGKLSGSRADGLLDVRFTPRS
jgi:hypothetical protein